MISSSQDIQPSINNSAREAAVKDLQLYKESKQKNQVNSYTNTISANQLKYLATAKQQYHKGKAVNSYKYQTQKKYAEVNMNVLMGIESAEIQDEFDKKKSPTLSPKQQIIESNDFMKVESINNFDHSIDNNLKLVQNPSILKLKTQKSSFKQLKSSKSNVLQISNYVEPNRHQKSNKPNPIKYQEDLIDNMKKRAYSNLNNYYQCEQKKGLLKQSQKEIEQFDENAKKALSRLKVHKMITEKQLMNLQVENLDLQDQLTEVKQRNENMEDKLQALFLDYNELKVRLENLSEYEQAMNTLQEQFPNTEFNSIVKQYDQMVNSKVKEITFQNDLIDRNNHLEKQIKIIEKQLSQKTDQVESQENKENLQQKIKPQFQKCCENVEHKKEKQRQIDFFNDFINFYNTSLKSINVYKNGIEKEYPHVPLDSPEEILQNLKENIIISTNQNLQKKLRQIIRISHKLHRKYFNEKINEVYHPEKVYDRITVYIDDLHKKLKNHQEQTKQLKSSVYKHKEPSQSLIKTIHTQS